tara:strand:+ start:78 stop:311 length:234 start_codon:yes stop_codon:yes gene_type:complete
MLIQFRRLIFSISFNLFLFLFLIIGIQNSSNKNKVYFLGKESIDLPISFIIGVSLISGSIAGSLINIDLSSKKNNDL